MLSSDIAIRVSEVSKCFEIYNSPSERLKEFLPPRYRARIGLQKHPYFSEFWALRNISFEVKKGETVGVIGRNGSGKSTLLQIICGTLSPTNGAVVTRGRIAALLELGSGFNPDFTGRENVFMNGAILGLSKAEVEARFDDIASFANVGQFLDQPVRNYSSGMVVRLAFAVQSQVDPDILIVDEALAVGDAKFQSKCYERLRQLKEDGSSILLVTHSNEQIVTHCSSAILIDSGRQVEMGEPKHVVNCFQNLMFGKQELQDEGEELVAASAESAEKNEGLSALLEKTEDHYFKRKNYNPDEYRWGDRKATIIDFHFSNGKESFPSIVSSGQTITLSAAIVFGQNISKPILGINIKTSEGVTVYGKNSDNSHNAGFDRCGDVGSVTVVETSFVCRLAPGDYFISLGVASRIDGEVVPHDRRYDSIHFQVQGGSDFAGLVDLELEMKVRREGL